MVDVDLSQLPFTLIDDAGRDHVRRGMDLAFFDRDEVILEMGQAGESVFLIHKGEVAGQERSTWQRRRKTMAAAFSKLQV